MWIQILTGAVSCFHPRRSPASKTKSNHSRTTLPPFRTYIPAVSQQQTMYNNPNPLPNSVPSPTKPRVSLLLFVTESQSSMSRTRAVRQEIRISMLGRRRLGDYKMDSERHWKSTTWWKRRVGINTDRGWRDKLGLVSRVLYIASPCSRERTCLRFAYLRPFKALAEQELVELMTDVFCPVPQSSLMLHKRRSKPLSTTNKVVNKSFPKL